MGFSAISLKESLALGELKDYQSCKIFIVYSFLVNSDFFDAFPYAMLWRWELIINDYKVLGLFPVCAAPVEFFPRSESTFISDNLVFESNDDLASKV